MTTTVTATVLPVKVDTIRKVELPEGVDVRLAPAGPFIRSLALALDFLLIGALLVIIGLLSSFLGTVIPTRVAQGLSMIAGFCLFWGYFCVQEFLYGATPGKRSMGVRVVSLSGSPITFRQAVIRSLLLWADFLPFGFLAGLCFSSLTRSFQRIGDLAAGTVVIHAANKQVPTQSHLLPRANGLAVPLPVALTLEEQRALVAFLDRAPQWSQARLDEMTRHLDPILRRDGRSAVDQAIGMGRWLRGEIKEGEGA